MTPPKLSVCIEVFNYARFLPEAIESVLGQTFTDFELIIGDDCSTDDSYELAQAYAAKDRRIRVRRNAQNLGMVKNRNECLREARGEFVKILHADDFLCSIDALARMVAALELTPVVVGAACARRIVNDRSEPVDLWSCFDDLAAVAGTTIINLCLREQRNLIGGPSAVISGRMRPGADLTNGFS